MAAATCAPRSDHEHEALKQRLHSTSASDVMDTLELLLAHLESEERYVITPRVLRDDLVSLEGAG